MNINAVNLYFLRALGACRSRSGAAALKLLNRKKQTEKRAAPDVGRTPGAAFNWWRRRWRPAAQSGSALTYLKVAHRPGEAAVQIDQRIGFAIGEGFSHLADKDRVRSVVDLAIVAANDTRLSVGEAIDA